MSHRGKVIRFNEQDQTFDVEGYRHRVDLTVDDFKGLEISHPSELVGCVVEWERDNPYIVIAMGVKVLERPK